MKGFRVSFSVTFLLVIVSAVAWIPQIVSGGTSVDPMFTQSWADEALQDLPQEVPCDDQQPSAAATAKGYILHKILTPKERAKISPLGRGSFDNFYRFPAEEKFLKAMDRDANGVAFGYYRDVLLGGRTFFFDAQEGDTQTAEYRFENGQGINQFAVFRKEFNGQQNCFVFSDGSVECGATDAIILWIFTALVIVSATWSQNPTE